MARLRRRRPWAAALRSGALAAAALCAAALPLSRPIRTDADVPTAGNKFLRRTATRDGFAPKRRAVCNALLARAPACADARTRCAATPRSADDEEPDALHAECGDDVTLRWAAEVASSVYAAPLVTDLFADGAKQVVVPTFVHYLEVLQAR